MIIPLAEGQPIVYEEFSETIPYEGKWEMYDGHPFGGEYDDLLLNFLKNKGLRYVYHLLPSESKEILKGIIDESEK